MKQISFGRGVNSWYSLIGSNQVPGVKGAIMAPAAGSGETVEEVIDLQLGGTIADLESGINLLGQIVGRAARWQEMPEEDRLYLECQVTAESALCRSLLVGGWLELLKGADYRQGGSQGARLHLARVNWWEAGTSERELTPAGGFVVWNHQYGANYNSLTLYDTVVAPGTPLRVHYEMLNVGSAPTLLYIGQQRHARGGLDTFYRGLDGGGRSSSVVTSVNSPSCAGGAYASIAWTSGGSWALKRMWAITLTGEIVDALAGKMYKTLLRVPAGLTERTLCKLDVSYLDANGEKILWESDSFYLETGAELLEGPAVCVPPWQVGGAGGSPALLVNLSLGTAGGGAKTFKLDYLALLPLDAWRICRPYLGVWGVNLVDDGNTGWLRSPAGVMTHTSEGPGGYALGPHEYAQLVFYVAVEAAGLQTASANLTARVRVYARDRRLTL